MSVPHDDSSVDVLFSDSDTSESAHQLYTQFSMRRGDEEHFRGISKYHYKNSIIPLRRGQTRYLNYTYHSQLSDDGKRQMGALLAENGQIKQMSITFSEMDPTSVDNVFRGPFADNHSLRRFSICAKDNEYSCHPVTLSLNDWNGIKNYLTKAEDLRHLNLNSLEIRRDEGLSRRDETIDIVDCEATAGGTCEGLANIISNGSTKLDAIRLDNNELGDECIDVLCQSLKQNTSVRTIHLHHDNEITDEGWKLFEKLVFDKSSIENVYLSNHHLQVIEGHPHKASVCVNQCELAEKLGHKKVISYLIRHDENDISSSPPPQEHDMVRVMGGVDVGVEGELVLIDGTDAVLKEHYMNCHAKIVDFAHLAKMGKVYFDIQPFVDYDVEIMPCVLSFFGKTHHKDLIGREFRPLFFIFELLRLWDVATLFGFGSASSDVAHSVEMDALKVENQS